VIVKSTIFGDVMLCSLVKSNVSEERTASIIRAEKSAKQDVWQAELKVEEQAKKDTRALLAAYLLVSCLAYS
jgi:hypothetical protein